HHLHPFQQFLGLQVLQLALVGVGGDQQVAVVVRETVEHHHRPRLAQDDQVAPVVLLFQALADKTGSFRIGYLGAGHVGESPRGPELFHQEDTSLVSKTGSIATCCLRCRSCAKRQGEIGNFGSISWWRHCWAWRGHWACGWRSAGTMTGTTGPAVGW